MNYDGRPSPTPRRFEPMSAEALDARVTSDGTESTSAELARAEQVKAQSPHTAPLPTPTVAALVRLVDPPGGVAAPAVGTVSAAPPAHQRRRDLRVRQQWLTTRQPPLRP